LRLSLSRSSFPRPWERQQISYPGHVILLPRAHHVISRLKSMSKLQKEQQIIINRLSVHNEREIERRTEGIDLPEPVDGDGRRSIRDNSTPPSSLPWPPGVDEQRCSSPRQASPSELLKAARTSPPLSVPPPASVRS
jgi:hypothetical protein